MRGAMKHRSEIHTSCWIQYCIVLCFLLSYKLDVCTAVLKPSTELTASSSRTHLDNPSVVRMVCNIDCEQIVATVGDDTVTFGSRTAPLHCGRATRYCGEKCNAARQSLRAIARTY